MDFEEREKQRKRQTLKVVIAELGMFISVVAIVVVTTLAAMGFFVTENGSIEQTGLVQIHSMPTGATVELDGGVIFSRTNLSRSLTPGEHSLKLSRDGYDTWEKQVRMYSGMLIRLYYPRLFLENRTAETVMNWPDGLEFFSASMDQTSVLYAFENSAEWKLLDIKGDDTKVTTLDLTKVLPGVEDGKFVGRVEQMAWSKNSDQVVIQVSNGDQNEWVLVNLRDVTRSLNLTRTFGMNFAQVAMIDDSAAQLFVLENRHLRKINVADQAISRVLLDNVSSFASNENDLVYVATVNNDEQTQQIVGVYRDGDKGGTIIAKVDDDKHVEVALSEYYSEDYILYTVGDQLTVYYGTLPAYREKAQETDFSGMKALIQEQQLAIVPEKVDVSLEGEYFVAQNGKKWAVIDIDMGDVFEYEAPAAAVNWLGTSMLSSTVDGQVKVWDFDNTNQRVLVATQEQNSGDEQAKAVTTISKMPIMNYPIAVSANDRWLYYVVKTEKGLALQREKLRE